MTTTIYEPTPQHNEPVASKWVVLAVLALGQLMVVLDTTIVNVALPAIQAALHFSSPADLQWVVTAYILTFGGFLLLGGRVADRFGRRRMFIAGALLFAAASLAGGLADAAGLLVAARAFQGLGAACRWVHGRCSRAGPAGASVAFRRVSRRGPAVHPAHRGWAGRGVCDLDLIGGYRG
ncbi:MAG: MFS transporter [Acidimicrobiaceae bacterium]|nr:MFS transporter [Acidimicrobiaceae bacterium]